MLRTPLLNCYSLSSVVLGSYLEPSGVPDSLPSPGVYLLLCQSPPEALCHEQITHRLSAQQRLRLGLHQSGAGISINSWRLEFRMLAHFLSYTMPAFSSCLSKARDNRPLTVGCFVFRRACSMQTTLEMQFSTITVIFMPHLREQSFDLCHKPFCASSHYGSQDQGIPFSLLLLAHPGSPPLELCT